MRPVLVHGHPESSTVWEPVAELLGVNPLLVQLPGYGGHQPREFSATKDEYADWLIAGIEELREPVDLVGHDWGAILVVRVACLRPELVRSWTADAAIAALHEDHQWHGSARVWQTPGQGEAFAAAALASSEGEAIAGFSHLGMPASYAIQMSRAWTTEMWDCALRLYRSAVDLADDWGRDLAKARVRPGLVVLPEHDWAVQRAWVEACAAQASARLWNLSDLGHWWLLEDPSRCAELLETFWESVPEETVNVGV